MTHHAEIAPLLQAVTCLERYEHRSTVGDVRAQSDAPRCFGANDPELAAVRAPQSEVAGSNPADAHSTQAGPQDCCSAFAAVEKCDGVTDVFLCPFCGYSWEAPCR